MSSPQSPPRADITDRDVGSWAAQIGRRVARVRTRSRQSKYGRASGAASARSDKNRRAWHRRPESCRASPQDSQPICSRPQTVERLRRAVPSHQPVRGRRLDRRRCEPTIARRRLPQRCSVPRSRQCRVQSARLSSARRLPAARHRCSPWRRPTNPRRRADHPRPDRQQRHRRSASSPC